ncbi:MAG: hypothetical protein KC635_18370, partial [Myxococcales bacterium]|nr:hypothetical protein [Myxococcales bacterium]
MVLTAAAVVVACSDQPAPLGDAADLAVAVAPLQLEGIAAACYGLRVENASQEEVWSASHLCSTRYGSGAGGDIAYVGTCDASDGEEDNTVYLTIEGLYLDDADDDGDFGAGDPTAEFVDPCTAPYAPNGCAMPARCVPNGDARVDFDVTVMRPAQQGFFDVVVNFEDVFCSAKVDCVREGDAPIELVFDPVSGQRIPTVVVAFACSDGDDDAATHLYMDDLKLYCGARVYDYDVAAGPGNVDPAAGGPVSRFAVFEGRDVSLGGSPGDGIYWNVALGLSPSYFGAGSSEPKDCTLHGRATATAGARANGVLPAGTYPIIDFDVPLTSAAGARVCTRHPLGSSEVATHYTHPETTVQLCNEAAPVADDAVDTRSIADCPAICAPVPPPTPPAGVTYGGVYFPGGDASFADAVVSFDPLFSGGPAATSPFYQFPEDVVGPPDWTTDLARGAVSLGNGGRLVMRFTDNALRGSGDDAPDLHIFEVGGDVESMYLDISKDGVNWLSIGKIGGAISHVDIDAYGALPTDLYRFVRVTDDTEQGETDNTYRGADIDAIGAIAT